MAEKSAPFALNAVKSSNVDAIGYDGGTRRFGVRFKSGATYHYNGVDAKTADAILSADSVGSAVNRLLVKGQVPFVKLEQDEQK